MVAIFFFFVETQYFRDYKSSSPVVEDHPSNEIVGPAEAEKEPGTTVTKSPPASHTSAIPKKTFLQELKPWSPRHPNTSYLSFIIRPWPLLVYPAVLYSFLTFSAAISWSICLLDTHASIFQAPPYNMTPGINSLIYISTIIGTAFGVYFGGAFTDRLAEWFARKNNGVFQPETRLIAMIFPFFVVPFGLLM
jgi:hypothetical protein